MMKSRRWTEEDLKKVGGGNRAVKPIVPNGQGTVAVDPLCKPVPSPYKSKLEAAFAQRLIMEQRAGNIDGWLYEPFTFRLCDGKRYRVDFVSWKWIERMTGGGYYATTAYECKGWHKNYRDSLTHLKWAAQRFPFFTWMKVVSNGKRGFEIMDVKV